MSGGKMLMALSRELEPARTNLEIALHLPVPATWDDEESFVEAAQPRAIGEVLIETLFPELEGARFAYLFKKEMHKGRDRVQLGHALKVAAKWTFLAELDFLIELNWTMWRQLQPAQRVALLDHELCHCGKNTEHGTYVLIHHDVEEFGGVVRRWGLWKQDLQLFSKQLDLFGERHKVPA